MTSGEIYINDPDGHRPHGPSWQGLLPREIFGLEPGAKGLFNSRSEEEVENLNGQVFEIAEAGRSRSMNVELYQMWCEQNWKEPHGSSDSFKRMSGKLLEECQEVAAVAGFEAALGSLTPERRKDVISEIGDLLWCATAVASDLKVNIKHALISRFGEYGQGTRNIEDGSVPSWVAIMQAHYFETQELKVSVLEDLVGAGYTPQLSPAMNIEEFEHLPAGDIPTALDLLYVWVGGLIKSGDNVYTDESYNDGRPVYARAVMTAPSTAIAEIYLISAYTARYCADSDIGEVIAENINKLSKRVSAGKIDKSDGERSADLL